MAWLTLGVHFLLLTVGRQVDPSLIPGFDYLFTFKWPPVVYALDIVAWDFSFGLALLAAAPVLTGTGRASSCPHGLVLAGVLCLSGLSGMVTANMQIRDIGIIGYAIVFPAVCLLRRACLGGRTPAESAVTPGLNAAAAFERPT